MLTVEGLRSRYGRIEVLHGIDLDVASGEIVTVVGANGAGKTTLLKCLSGIQPVSAGSIVFRGEALTTVPAHARVRRGLAQSPEGRQIFTNLTVYENVQIALGSFIGCKRNNNLRREGDKRAFNRHEQHYCKVIQIGHIPINNRINYLHFRILK